MKWSVNVGRQWIGLAGALLGMVAPTAGSRALEAVVEVEEPLYRYESANNGAGPMWCAGSTCLARVGDLVYATGLETIPGAKPLNNCRWVLWRRDEHGWRKIHVDEAGRTREPAPLVVCGDREVFVSGNPTLAEPGTEGGGPARPEVWRFGERTASGPERLVPVWSGEPRFTEHSYRSFAADATRREFVLFQNIDYTHAEWAFRDGDEKWAARGRLEWPWGASYAKPQPVRICYPNVALHRGAVHLFGVSDILEPNPAWRAFKKELTGREWDYDFRRLFYTSAPDVRVGRFSPWIEVASREETGGWLWPCDLWVEPSGSVRVLWTERAIDERLRPKFFPEAKQSHSLRLARIEDGTVRSRRVLVEAKEGDGSEVVQAARFHGMPDGRLLVFTFVTGDKSGNRLTEVGPDGDLSSAVTVPFRKAFTSYFTATPRGGSASSQWLDVLGVQAGNENTLSYARVKIR